MAFKQVFIGVITEGTTDTRFLSNIVERVFIDVAYDCVCDVEPIVKFLKIDKKKLSFNDYVKKAIEKGTEDIGMMVLCVHSDSDSDTMDVVLQNKIKPVYDMIDSFHDSSLCNIVVPIIPVQMIEAWMLADIELLKREIGTNKSNRELGLERKPESISNPKYLISEVIRIARQDIVKRKRNDLDISDLYNIGQKIELDKLMNLSSFAAFRTEIREAYRKLHLIVD